MTPQQQTANVIQPSSKRERGDFESRFNLTRAEVRALRRCAPLTPQFKDIGHLVEPAAGPLRSL